MDVHAEVWSEHVWENTKNCALANFQVDKSFIPTSGGAGKGGGSARAGGDGDGAGVKGNAAGEEKSSVDSKEGEDEDLTRMLARVEVSKRSRHRKNRAAESRSRTFPRKSLPATNPLD